MTVWNRNRYTNPTENLRSYVRVHGGVDRNERISDVEMIEAKLQEAHKLRELLKTHWLLLGRDTSQSVWEDLQARTIAAIEDYDAL